MAVVGAAGQVVGDRKGQAVGRVQGEGIWRARIGTVAVEQAAVRTWFSLRSWWWLPLPLEMISTPGHGGGGNNGGRCEAGRQRPCTYQDSRPAFIYSPNRLRASQAGHCTPTPSHLPVPLPCGAPGDEELLANLCRQHPLTPTSSTHAPSHLPVPVQCGEQGA